MSPGASWDDPRDHYHSFVLSSLLSRNLSDAVWQSRLSWHEFPAEVEYSKFWRQREEHKFGSDASRCVSLSTFCVITLQKEFTSGLNTAFERYAGSRLTCTRGIRVRGPWGWHLWVRSMAWSGCPSWGWSPPSLERAPASPYTLHTCRTAVPKIPHIHMKPLAFLHTWACCE